jgi:hypothetical protein
MRNRDWNPADHPRWPAGSGDKSGEFMGNNSVDTASVMDDIARGPRDAAPAIREAEDTLRDWGLDSASLGNNPEVAQQVMDALSDIRDRGVPLPKNVVVDGDYFDERYGAFSEQVPGQFSTRGPTVYVNPNAIGFRSPTDAARTAREQKDSGWWSSDDPLHPLYHEMGHAAHHAAFPDLYHGYDDDIGPDHFMYPMLSGAGRSVSQYSQRDAKEFVAEVFAGRMAGNDYPPDVTKLYNKLGGQPL